MNEDKRHRDVAQEISVEITVDSPEQTILLAEHISKYLNSGDIICLSGDLGAGKTFFSQALCKALGVEDYVTSPTFNIMNQYDGKFPVYHFDVYRIADEDEMYEIGFEEFIFGRGVSIIEWASLIENLIPKTAIWIDILTTGETSRKLILSGQVEKLGRFVHEVIGH